ncbi:MAG TPA: TonB-dependent receptor [Prevotella sp.]
MLKRMQVMIAMMLLFTSAIVAQVTTSGISGKIVSGSEQVIGATITATHQPSGTVYRAVTNVDGRFTIQGMRVGGPYKVDISYVGHQTKTFNNVTLILGETQNLSCSLQEDAHELDELVVTGKSGLNATKTGAAMSIDADMISKMPSVSHSISDIARMNPQISTNNQSGAMSFAGTNNRYNAFQIDGAMNNDVFGLTSNGSNGGQANTQPVSMETIDQIQINVAPFDVRQSGFTGGAINAITKSGTNEFHGSAYVYGNNEDLLGKHYKNPDGTYSQPYNDEKEYLYGFTLGGPIIKNKLFFFANYEKSKKEYPNQYGIGAEGSIVDAAKATEILDNIKEMALAQGYTYNQGYVTPNIFNKSDKMGVKLDWNINDFNKLSVRWNYVTAGSMKANGGLSTVITGDHPYEFKSKTHTFTAELQSRLSPVLSNEARVTYVNVRDARTSGAAFPSINISNVGTRGASVNIGNEYSSMANSLDQDVFTVEDNLTWYNGNHTLTFGTHNEFYQFANLFIQNLYGSYYFGSYDDFKTYYNNWKGGTPDGSVFQNFYYQQANVDITGDPKWKAKFGAGQLGFYVQDKWDVTNNFQLTYGLRMDMPLFFDTPAENKGFNDYAAAQGWDYKTNRKLSSAPMWSPRVGFRWDIENNRKFILRGGVGIFTGRIPFVWLSNNFSNTGVQMSSYTTKGVKDLRLILDPEKQNENAQILKASGSQLINVFDKDFKFAQTLRFNLGFDAHLLGIDWTAEAIYSKNLNDVYYQNLAYEESGQTFSQMSYGYAWDNRPMYQRKTTGTPYNNIYLMKNTSKGYTYSLSLKGEKSFDFGLDLMASYTFTKSKSISSVTSSVAASNYNNTHTYRFSNSPELGNSAYNVPHTIKASAFYHLDWGRNKLFTTTIGVIYEGRSGSPYSLLYSSDFNGDYSKANDLMFIPTDEQIDQMQFVPSSSFTADQQRENLKQWLGKTRYLKDHRGEYYKRYADNLPFEHHFDLHAAQKVNIKVGKYVHALELTMDIMNVANLLNKDWGRSYGSGYSSEFMSPLTYSGNGKFQFSQTADYVLKYPDTYYSRWRGQIGLKYTF